ncbi:MAG: CinA family protein [Clostridia bacterium]|nr:CinA family protein [Clostridia bacterium]
MITEKAKDLLSYLKEKGLVFATAESCTGGMVGEIITSLSGASEVYCGGIISYTNHVKNKVLGVCDTTLETYDAVSEETAKEMAQGARRLTDADIAVSITGFAGPGGGTASKPVGTVCFGIDTRKGTKTFRKQFGEDLSREDIRSLAAAFALDKVYEAAKEL